MDRFIIRTILFINLILTGLFWVFLVFAQDAIISIGGADEQWVSEVNQPLSDSQNADFELPSDEAIICQADEAWTSNTVTPDNMLLDATFGGEFELKIEAVVCGADSVLTESLAVPDLSEAPEIPVEVPTKTPVLFVPGLLSTEISGWNDMVWINDEMFDPSNSDDFMDVLAFDPNLTPAPGDNGLTLKGVLRDKKISILNTVNFYFDYTESLIKEFEAQGYIENETFFTFPYDWRYGVSGVYPNGKTNSELLEEKINEILEQTGSDRVDVIAHSLGGLVTKKYIIDHDDPKIGKLVYLGVPNLGSPEAAKALLMGTDFKIFGLNSDEIKKISQNMPVVYDLLPSEEYIEVNGSYIKSQIPYEIGKSELKELSYEETILHLNSNGANTEALVNAKLLHSNDFDSYQTNNNIETYNIVGCKSGTLKGIIDYQTQHLDHYYYNIDNDPQTGDDTVPFESANSIPADNNNIFYFQKAEHGKMPSSDGIRQKIVNIITDTNYPEYKGMITHDQLVADSSLCELKGDHITIKSPVHIFVTDQDGNRMGFDGNGNILYEIPGASFYEVDGHKYVFLPNGDGEVYYIKLTGTGDGTFTLIDNKIEGDQITSSQVFNDIPVTTSFNAVLDISGGSPRIKVGGGEMIEPTSEIAANAAEDLLPPVTEAVIDGTGNKPGFYRGDVLITLTAADYAQSGVQPSGVYSISYSLDGTPATTTESISTTISVVGEGSHTISFFATDKLGNKEEIKAVDFVIDNAAPEISINDPTGNAYLLNQPAAAQYDCIDMDSGINSCTGTIENGSNIDTATVGEHVFTVTATDNAGNQAIKTITYRVIYKFEGFLQPINDTAHEICSGCQASIFKAGSTVPVKFKLKDYNGNIVQAANSPVWITPAKGSSIGLPIDETLYTEPATSGNLFRWDENSRQYLFNWGTKGYDSGYFWRIGVRLDDGTILVTNIGLK